MKIIHGYRDVKKFKDPVVTIGVFDGVHLGHQKVIRKILNKCYDSRDRVLITFDPHPIKILRPHMTPPRIMSLEHRLSIFEKMGLDATVVIKFSDFIAMMSPEEFVKRVITVLGARTVYVGANFHFGRGKSGDIEALKEIGRKYGIGIHTVPPVKKNGKIVSSTWLRRIISRGEIKKAEKLLRRPVSVLGTVVKGEERGRRLGIPTANIDPHHEVIPPPGVYAVKIDLGGKLRDGVINIGFKPTFYGRRPGRREEPFIEVHLFDFEGNLYGRTPEIFFIKRLRKEKRFRNEKALIRQIEKDMIRAKKLLGSKRIIWKIKRYKGMS